MVIVLGVSCLEATSSDSEGGEWGFSEKEAIKMLTQYVFPESL